MQDVLHRRFTFAGGRQIIDRPRMGARKAGVEIKGSNIRRSPTTIIPGSEKYDLRGPVHDVDRHQPPIPQGSATKPFANFPGQRDNFSRSGETDPGQIPAPDNIIQRHVLQLFQRQDHLSNLLPAINICLPCIPAVASAFNLGVFIRPAGCVEIDVVPTDLLGVSGQIPLEMVQNLPVFGALDGGDDVVG